MSQQLKSLFIFTLCLSTLFACKKEDPQTPAKPADKTNAAQSAGYSPFNKTDLAGWKTEGDANKNFWKATHATITKDSNGALVLSDTGEKYLVNTAIGNNLYTEKKFGDCNIKLEFLPAQGTNSGVFLMGEYELQIETVEPESPPLDTDHGAIVQLAAPKVNASKPLGQWQSYDITFQAPRYDDKGKKIQNAKIIKIILNGKVVQENLEIPESSLGCLSCDEPATGPLMLQGLEGTIAFRNIVITELKK